MLPLSVGIIKLSWCCLCAFHCFKILAIETTEASEVPASGARHYVPPYMWQIYKYGNGNGNKGEVIKGLAPRFFGPFFRNRLFPNHGKQEIRYEIPKGTKEESLIGAEIRIATRDIGTLRPIFYLFYKEKNWIFLDAKAVRGSGPDWIALETMKAFKSKIQIPRENEITFLLLSVSGNTRDTSIFRSLKNFEPLLLLSYSNYTEEMGLNYNEIALYSKAYDGRSKRELARIAEDREERTNRIWEGLPIPNSRIGMGNACTRKPLYVEFSKIDFDSWIVAPTGYQAFQCSGNCIFPVGEHQTPTKHAIIQTLIHLVAPAKVGRACCVPTRLEPISVLYLDGEGILTYRFRFPDMVVAECGCR